jgi:hypothetical protein
MFAKGFLDNWYAKGLGLPHGITSDRDTRFTSQFWKAICDTLDIAQHLSTAYHQETDGQSENAIKTTKQALKHHANYAHNNWSENLPLVEFAINDSRSASTGFSPFYLSYGRHPKTLPDTFISSSPAADDFITTMAMTSKQARANIIKALEHQKKHADKNRKESPQYKAGDKVLLNSENITWAPGSLRPNSATHQWLGPFVIKGPGSNPENYELILTHALKSIHPVFHTRVLKAYHEPSTIAARHITPGPEPVLINNEEHFLVEKILDTRVHNKKRQFLIKWQGYGDEHNLWLPASKNKDNPVEFKREKDYLATLTTTATPMVSTLISDNLSGGAVTVSQ